MGHYMGRFVGEMHAAISDSLYNIEIKLCILSVIHL